MYKDYFGSQIQRFLSMVNWPVSFGSKHHCRKCGLEEYFSSHIGKRKRKKKGPGNQDPFWEMPLHDLTSEMFSTHPYHAIGWQTNLYTWFFSGKFIQTIALGECINSKVFYVCLVGFFGILCFPCEKDKKNFMGLNLNKRTLP
jgi:hypothetical protein